MKICIIAEGCYPYVLGGVSNWIHEIIKSFPNIEFNLVSIVSDRSVSGKFTYDLPDNLTNVYEVYLQDVDWLGKSSKVKRKNSEKIKRTKLDKAEVEALKSLIIGEDVDWTGVFQLFNNNNLSVNDLLMSPEFLNISKEFYALKYNNIAFTDFLWTLRSIYLPMFLVLKYQPPVADIYHCVSTGYAGIIGSKAVSIYPNTKLIVSEHGIYTREREEEIIKANWVKNIYKLIWINQFKKMSNCAYHFSDLVTSLFKQAQTIQLELGCPLDKAIIIPNGIEVDKFKDIPQKDPDDPYINVGAILRVTPIKDVKTMINSFYYAQKKVPQLKLWILGPEDEDLEYAKECHNLVDALGAKNIVFGGRIQTTDYIGKMDFMILTSISEGQPLTILEGFATKKPCIATNVGDCAGLIYGEDDLLGHAGIVVSVMNISEIISAVIKLAKNPDIVKRMGENGYNRLMNSYQHKYMIESYRKIYKGLFEMIGAS